MRTALGFVAGVATGAFVWSACLVFENPPADFGLLLGLMVVILAFSTPVALAGGLPIVLLLRWRKVQAWWIHALLGALLGLGIYLLLGVPVSQPSDHPMTYAENLARPFHVSRGLVTMLAGWIRALVYWDIAVNGRPRNRLLRSVRVRLRWWTRKAVVAVGGGRDMSDLSDV